MPRAPLGPCTQSNTTVYVTRQVPKRSSWTTVREPGHLRSSCVHPLGPERCRTDVIRVAANQLFISLVVINQDYIMHNFVLLCFVHSLLSYNFQSKLLHFLFLSPFLPAGYRCEGNEFSMFMLMASNLILNA